MIRGNPHKFLSAAIGLCAFGALSTFAGEMPTAGNGWIRESIRYQPSAFRRHK